MTPETMLLPDGSEVIPIHLVTMAYGIAQIACMPGLRDLASGKYRQVPFLRTDEVRSVNCPRCKATKEYETAKTAAMNAKLEWRCG